MDQFAVVAVLALPVVAIVLAAFALSLVMLLQYRLAGRVSPEVRTCVALALISLGAVLSVVLMSRTLDESQREAVGFVVYEDLAGGFAASRWLSLFLVAAALVEVLRGWLRARAAPIRDGAAYVGLAALTFYVGVLLVQTVGAEHRGFSHKDLYLPTILMAVYYQRVARIEPVLDTAKALLFLLMIASLAAMAVAPDFVLHHPDAGVIPGVDWRLYGLTAHANTLAPGALIAIILELHRPSKHSALRYAQLAAAATVLLLAQSKTTWAAGLVIAACVSIPMALRPRAGAGRPTIAFQRSVWVLVGCLAALIALTLALVGYGGADYLQRTMELTTLNGRFAIWDITLQAWRDNLLFGYGSEIWGSERQFRFNMFHVGHAHNQIVQTLGESGLVGVVLLLAFLVCLVRASLRSFVASRGLVLALLLVLLARCATEAPMRSEGILSWSTFLLVLILVVACHYLRLSPPARAHASVRPAARADVATPPSAPGFA